MLLAHIKQLATRNEGDEETLYRMKSYCYGNNFSQWKLSLHINGVTKGAFGRMASYIDVII